MLYNLLQAIEQWLDDIGLYSLVQVMYQLEFRAFFSVVFSFLLVLFFGRRVIGWLIRMKVSDNPEFHNADLNQLMESRAATPTMGGILIVGSMLVTILLFADLKEPYVHLALLTMLWLAFLGVADDWLKLTVARRTPGSREGLRTWEKLLFQMGLGFILGWQLYRHGSTDLGDHLGHVLTLPLQRTYLPGTNELSPSVIMLGFPVFVLLTMLLVGGTSNAVNFTDGMDGLATGCIVVASFAMMVLCYVAGDADAARTLLFPFINGGSELMVVTGAMAGASLGFLWFNCAPAQVFMGDTGSLSLGGLLAFVAVAIRQEVLLIVIGGVFFVEMASVIMQVGYFRMSKGKRIWRCAPIHHHYHLAGWSEGQIVTRAWVLAIICAMIALVSMKLR